MMRKFVINTLVLVFLIGVSGIVYIRLAPDDILALHIAPPAGAVPGSPIALPGGYLVEENSELPPEKLLQRLHSVILQTPRTRLIAGLPSEGMATYVTRSLVFGFPDYTTIRVAPEGGGSRFQIYARLRYGRSDFGGNRERVTSWLRALEARRQ